VDHPAQGEAGGQKAHRDQRALQFQLAIAVEAGVAPADKAAHQHGGMGQPVPEPAGFTEGGVKEEGGDQDHAQGYSAGGVIRKRFRGGCGDFAAQHGFGEPADQPAGCAMPCVFGDMRRLHSRNTLVAA
jgi:hypothetical protein